MKHGIVLLMLICLMAASVGAQAESFTPITVDEDAYLNNIDVCLDTIGEVELDAGDTFSFNAVVGGRTEEKGYQTATNGRGVEVVGGGVAQVATTIYLAVKNCSDLELLEMHAYGSDFCEDYAPDASEAVYTDYAQSLDFRFANRGDPRKLNLWRNGSRIYCSIEEADE